MSENLDSAVLTAMIKSLKVLQSIQTSQDNLVQSVSDLKKGQSEARPYINKISTLPEQDDFQKLSNLVMRTHEKISGINNEITILSELIETRMHDMNENVHSLIVSTEESLSKDIASSNSAENLKTIKRLVDGLQNMQQNMNEVAKRIETLSSNVNGVRDDTRILSSSIIDSNSRVKSMDMRMGEFVSLIDDEPSTKKSPTDISSMINFLQDMDTKTDLNADINHLSGKLPNPEEVTHNED